MNKALKVNMSSGDSIQIDSTELEKVLEAIQKGVPVMVKRGIFNPSFYVSIVEDKERMKDFWDNIRYLPEEEKEKTIVRGPKELQDLFEKIRQLQESKRMLNHKEYSEEQENAAFLERKSA